MKIYIRITALLLMLSMLIVTLASCGVTEGIGVSVNDNKNSGAQENSLSEIVISEADKVLGDSPAYKLEELKAELGGDGRGEHKDECEYDRDDEQGDKVLFPDHIPELFVRGDNKDCGKDIEEKGNSASNKPAQSESDNATEHGESLAPVSDTERFIYGLMITELGLYYDVFSAMVTLSDGTEVYGIGFTDYSEAFKSVSEDKTYFSAGFISLVGEAVIPTTEWENGIEMERISDIDSEYGFICSFTRDAFSSHFVVFGEYVIYGINDAAGIVFETREYDRMTLSKELDPRLGSLYSYDDERYLVDYDLGNNLAVGGISVSEMIDYEALREEVERAIREQDQSLVTVDIETSVYIAQEALNAYLLSIQEETFFGYPVSELIRISSELDPMSCIRITDEGLELIEVQPAPPPTPSGLMKWLTGITAGLVVAGGVALACFGMPHLGGAVIGAAIQVFTEVIIENKVIGDIDWRKVAIASLAGALTATMGLMGDSLVGGATNAVFTLMDGGDLTSAVVSFGVGVCAGVALGGA
ncbi:MAG: hypothetical protein IJY04_02860, partial [Clostridia bacterium]|nr:hypothetical protein [Clostridia bacterium]